MEVTEKGTRPGQWEPWETLGRCSREKSERGQPRKTKLSEHEPWWPGKEALEDGGNEDCVLCS